MTHICEDSKLTPEERKHFKNVMERAADTCFRNDLDSMYDLIERWYVKGPKDLNDSEWPRFLELVDIAVEM